MQKKKSKRQILIRAAERFIELVSNQCILKRQIISTQVDQIQTRCLVAQAQAAGRQYTAQTPGTLDHWIRLEKQRRTAY